MPRNHHFPLLWIGHTRTFALPWLLMLMLLGIPSLARADGFIQEKTFFRVNIGGRTFRLEGLTMKRADASGRLPIALITHGKSANLQEMLDKHATDFIGAAKDLAHRGWLAVVVMRRGFGQSDGPYPAPVSCQSTSFIERFSADADDLAATLEVIASRPDVDATRVIAIGVSAGGAAVMALSARNPPNLRAVINVSGGLPIPSCLEKDVLVKAFFKELGTKSRVPTLWLYAKNDSRFRPDVVGWMRGAFLDGGGDAKLVMFDPLGQDGHDLFSLNEGRLKWLQEMDALLRFHKLPTWQRQDVSALMNKLNAQEQQRGLIEGFVAAPLEKALVQGSGGKTLYYRYGGKAIGDTRNSALHDCQKQRPPEQCQLVMENDRWVGSIQVSQEQTPEKVR
jgi:dienelactone hydrolase